MEQVLFILRNGKISQWNLSHKKLLSVTDRGRRAVPYSSDTAKQYWEEWKENNQVVDGDLYDAIFLSEHLDDFGELPKWICANSTDKSVWTFEHLSLLAKENEFAQGVWLVQGNVKRLIGAEKADNAIELCLKSSLAFTLPKVVVQREAEELKKSKKTPLVKKLSKVKKTPKAQTQSKAMSNKTKPIVLAGGVAPEGTYKITDGHYRLEKTLIVGPQTHLAIKNAIIDFAPGVTIDLNGEDVVISDCEFNGEALDDEELVAAPFFSAKATSTFENCTFNGASYRAAIHSSASIKIKHCKFSNLIGEKTIGEKTHAILEASMDGTIECESAQWRDCVAPSITGFLISAGHVKVVACDFLNSTVGGFFKTFANYTLTMVACLFDNCNCRLRYVTCGSVCSVVSSTLWDNCLINCQGYFYHPCYKLDDVSLERLREVRERIKKGEYIGI